MAGERIRHCRMICCGVPCSHQLSAEHGPRPGRDRPHNRRGEWSLRRAPPPARCCPDRASASSVSSRRSLSRGCRPMEGSSSTYSTPRSFEPICVASRMRWPSPPESVAAERSSEISRARRHAENPAARQFRAGRGPQSAASRHRAIFARHFQRARNRHAVKSAMESPSP